MGELNFTMEIFIEDIFIKEEWKDWGFTSLRMTMNGNSHTSKTMSCQRNSRRETMMRVRKVFLILEL